MSCLRIRRLRPSTTTTVREARALHAELPDDGDFSQLWRHPTFPLLVMNGVRVPYFVKHVVRPGSAVLDVGCGGGLLAEPLAQAGFNMTAIDLSPRTIDFARSHAAGQGLKIRYLVGSAYAQPFPDESFDAVVSVRRDALAELTGAERCDRAHDRAFAANALAEPAGSPSVCSRDPSGPATGRRFRL